MWVSYTVFLSCLSSLEENSLRMSRKARLRGGPPSPCGLGSLKANSIPSLKQKTHTQDCGGNRYTKKKPCWGLTSSGFKISYLCSIAMASLVFSWSRPNVRAKRRASSLIPQKADVERSKLQPRSLSISLKSWNTLTHVTLLLFSVADRAALRKEGSGISPAASWGSESWHT